MPITFKSKYSPDVLMLEGWDMATLTMPDALKQKLLDSI